MVSGKISLDVVFRDTRPEGLSPEAVVDRMIDHLLTATEFPEIFSVDGASWAQTILNTPLPKSITLDARRRTSLAKIGRPEHTLYACETLEDGTIIMTPSQIVAAR